MNLLAIDTSAKVASVSLLDEERIISEYTLNTPMTHSQTLMPMCEQLLSTSGISLRDVDAFAVSVGPGSFTGLRIGISAVKAMAHTLQKPCIGVSTLDALAYQGSLFSGLVCAVMDARRQQVYHALYDTPTGKLVPDCAISITALAEELASYDRPVLLVGDGAELCYRTLKDTSLSLMLAPPHQRLQRACCVGLAALHQWQQGNTITASQLSPQYLRLPQAQRELLQKQKNQSRSEESN